MLKIVVGAQFGGEGKGKICSSLSWLGNVDISCRSGGVNSSHTVMTGDREFRLRMVPAASVIRPEIVIVYGAGSLLHIPTLFEELDQLGINPDLVRIDPNAGVVDEQTTLQQRQDNRYQMIGSTLTGTGYASAKRCKRELKLAKDYPELLPMISEIPEWLDEQLRIGADVILEGHQGLGLSNYHGDYPYTSSRDCIATALMSEVGIGLQHDISVILVVKVFPTRNHNGKLPNEMAQRSAELLGIREKGGGSWGIADNTRRVGGIDYAAIKRAVALNHPTYIAMTGMDYLDSDLRGSNNKDSISDEIAEFVRNVENVVGVSVGLISTGPETESVIIWNEDLVGMHMPSDAGAGIASYKRGRASRESAASKS